MSATTTPRARLLSEEEVAHQHLSPGSQLISPSQGKTPLLWAASQALQLTAQRAVPGSGGLCLLMNSMSFFSHEGAAAPTAEQTSPGFLWVSAADMGFFSSLPRWLHNTAGIKPDRAAWQSLLELPSLLQPKKEPLVFLGSSSRQILPTWMVLGHLGNPPIHNLQSFEQSMLLSCSNWVTH